MTRREVITALILQATVLLGAAIGLRYASHTFDDIFGIDPVDPSFADCLLFMIGASALSACLAPNRRVS